jgi:hypothetical protein
MWIVVGHPSILVLFLVVLPAEPTLKGFDKLRYGLVGVHLVQKAR